MTFANGSVYEGEFKAGEKEGRGKYTNANGQIYEGERKAGEQEGRGKCAFPDGGDEFDRLLGHLLCDAAERDDTASVALLVRAGASVDHQDDQGWTALFHAVINANVQLTEELISGAASLNVLNE